MNNTINNSDQQCLCFLINKPDVFFLETVSSSLCAGVKMDHQWPSIMSRLTPAVITQLEAHSPHSTEPCVTDWVCLCPTYNALLTPCFACFRRTIAHDKLICSDLAQSWWPCGLQSLSNMQSVTRVPGVFQEAGLQNSSDNLRIFSIYWFIPIYIQNVKFIRPVFLSGASSRN